MGIKFSALNITMFPEAARKIIVAVPVTSLLEIAVLPVWIKISKG